MITKELIIKLTCEYFQIPESDLIGKRTYKSNRNDSSQRFICWYLIYKNTKNTEQGIADYFGFSRNDVHYGLVQVAGWLKVNEVQTVLAIEGIEEMIRNCNK